jgi:predicted Zn-ribbon and HTH transcriptional regulator
MKPTMLIPIFFSIFYLLACFGVATAAKNKKVGSQKTFHIAVLLTPLIALFVVVFSSKKQMTELQVSHCKRCGFEYSEKLFSCPACAKEGLSKFVKESIKREVSLK